MLTLLALLAQPALAEPTLYAPSPSQGAPGTLITLRGTGLVEGAQVRVCDAPAQDVRVLSAESLSFTLPAHPPGICSLQLTLPDGSGTTLAAALRYVDAPAPAAPKGEDTQAYRGEDQVVTGTRIARRVTDAPVMTEVINAASIEAKGAVCLLDALTYEPGVKVDNMCAICNTTGVKLSGMPHQYTSLLIDGVPIYSSLGQTYGWMMLSAADVDRIEIVKGANSILYGSDAIGGVVNVITAAPGDEATARLTLEGGTQGYHYLTGSAGSRKGPLSVNLVATHAASDDFDRDGDEVSELTGYERANMAGTARYTTDKVEVLSRASATQENRQGGGMGSIIEVLSDERRGFSETILSTRLDGSTSVTLHVNPDLDWESTVAVNQHLQDSDYEGEVYVAKQRMIFAQTSALASLSDRYSLVSGLSYRGENLDENLALSEYNYNYTGVFAQGDWMPSRKVEVLHGLRYDYHNVFGSVVTPRLSLRLRPWHALTLRATAGTGFRAPTTFYEYSHGVRPEGYQLVMHADKPETSRNVNLSAQLDKGRGFRATVETGWNQVNDPISVQTNAEGMIEVYNVDDALDILSAEVQVQTSPVEGLNLTAGYGHYHYRDPGGSLVSAPPTDTVDVSADYTASFGFSASASASVFAPMDLIGVYGLGYNGQPDMNLTGWLDTANADLSSPKLTRSPWFATVDARVEQEVAEGISLYAGGKNLTDYHQSDVESPLYYPDDNGVAGPADVVYIWGPLRPRFLYAGIKVAI
ncbi:MAG: TonB-dependent receptor [Deltaproteobacteria bacterium]|nr:TonB-dependent receptor [Deltaproteobacteria bacterium]